MLKILLTCMVLLSACAHAPSASDSVNRNPDACREADALQQEPVNAMPKDGQAVRVNAVADLAVVAVVEPESFRCDSSAVAGKTVEIKRPDGSTATDYGVERP